MTQSPLHLVLVTPEIPANTGNIVRLCALTGVELHLVEPLGFHIDDRTVKRAGLDYWDDCSLTTHLTFEEIERAHERASFHFLSARSDASFFDRRVRPGDVLVLGPESTGLTNRFLAANDRAKTACRLPMPGRGRSLNLSTAAGVAVYESLRQLKKLGVEDVCRESSQCPA